jgi:hypothetical protein
MSKPRSKDMKLDPGTFGGSPACHVLTDMMNNNLIPIVEKHRVLAFINKATYQFKWISTIQECNVKARVMLLEREDLYNRITKMSYPDKFLDFLQNVINHHYNRYLKM